MEQDFAVIITKTRCHTLVDLLPVLLTLLLILYIFPVSPFLAGRYLSSTQIIGCLGKHWNFNDFVIGVTYNETFVHSHFLYKKLMRNAMIIWFFFFSQFFKKCRSHLFYYYFLLLFYYFIKWIFLLSIFSLTLPNKLNAQLFDFNSECAEDNERRIHHRWPDLKDLLNFIFSIGCFSSTTV